MTTLLERLELAGTPLTWLPPGDSASFKPVFASQLVQTLTGSVLVTGPLSGYTLTLNPPAEHVIPLSLKRQLDTAYATRTPVSLLETYSDPEAVTTWAAASITEFEGQEVAGSNRGLFTYKLTLWLGV